MKTDNISLPYPVLSIDDDILPSLPDNCISTKIDTDLRQYHVTITLSYQNRDISKLVNKGVASYTCEYECAKTMMRRCLKTQKPNFNIHIPRKDVAGRINFNCYITVVKPIPNYKNSGFNDDYANASFDMTPGDILAAFPPCHYDADIQYDKLQAAGAFMQIRKNEQIKDVFFDITGDKIEIQMSPSHFEAYCHQAVKSAAQILHSSLVLNALTYAILNINEHEETTWGRTIKYRLETENEFEGMDIYDAKQAPGIAQKLLKDPYMRMFNQIISEPQTTKEEEE